MPPSPLCSSFEAFATEARRMLDVPVSRVDDDVLAEFDAFASVAGTLLYRSAVDYVRWLSEAVRPLEPCLEPIDVLELSGITGDENKYTRLLAWLLYPTEHPEFAATCQRAWLGHVLQGFTPDGAAIPQPQLVTDDGIPDLVLRYGDVPVVVEAKTGTSEHPTPGSRSMQTIAYPAAVLRKFELPPGGPSHVIFLTPDRRRAANEDARPVSYLETALVLARAVDAATVPERVRQAYRAVLGHFAAHALPPGLDLADVLAAVRAWRATGDSDHAAIGRYARALNECADILPKT